MFDIRCIQINIRNAYSENINWEKYKDNFLDTCCIPFKRASVRGYKPVGRSARFACAKGQATCTSNNFPMTWFTTECFPDKLSTKI